MGISIIESCINPYYNLKTKEIFACGQCPACNRRRIREWTIRGEHELESHDGKASMITLTYSPKNLVTGARKKMCKEDRLGVLVPEDLTLFIKRLRKWINTKWEGRKIRYIACGEYGGLRWRPHYHMIVYGITPEELGGKKKGEEILKKIWKYGHVDLDERQMHGYGIEYVVGYLRKKIGQQIGGEQIYEGNGRPRPFMRSSQGIGGAWYDRYEKEILEAGSISWRGMKTSIPRYYLKRTMKKEGRTISWKEYNNEHSCEYKTIYKVIRNPEGTLTQKIYNLSKEKRVKEWKNLIEKNPKIKKELFDIFVSQEKQQDKYRIDNEILWNMDEDQAIDTCKRNLHLRKELKKKTTETKEQEGKILFRHIPSFYAEARQKAKEKNKKCSNSLYGHRENYELLEIINNTENEITQWIPKTERDNIRMFIKRIKLDYKCWNWDTDVYSERKKRIDKKTKEEYTQKRRSLWNIYN